MGRMHQNILLSLLIVFFVGLALFPKINDDRLGVLHISACDTLQSTLISKLTPDHIKVERDVHVYDYFEYLDSIIMELDTMSHWPVSEHLLVHANPWIIDKLEHTDYYRMKALDSFVYDQKQMVVLHKGAVLEVPDAETTVRLLQNLEQTLIDINIPEFRLRILQEEQVLHTFPIRVGRHEEKYLEMSGRLEDLRTKTGEGVIVTHVKNPRYVNPVDNHEYEVTRRDDNKVTKLPRIPFLEAELNGYRYGQLIHPTTNPETLGKAYSNGCIGTSEADAWRIYYHAPLGTKISIRYDLDVVTEDGDSIRLKDIYNLKE